MVFGNVKWAKKAAVATIFLFYSILASFCLNMFSRAERNERKF